MRLREEDDEGLGLALELLRLIREEGVAGIRRWADEVVEERLVVVFPSSKLAARGGVTFVGAAVVDFVTAGRLTEESASDIRFGFAPKPPAAFSSFGLPSTELAEAFLVWEDEDVGLAVEMAGREGGLLNTLERAAEEDVGLETVESFGATGFVRGFLVLLVMSIGAKGIQSVERGCKDGIGERCTAVFNVHNSVDMTRPRCTCRAHLRNALIKVSGGGRH